MKLTPPQQRAYNALRASPTGKISSDERWRRIVRTTMAALARMGLVELHLTTTERTRRHRSGRLSTYVTVTWTAELVPDLPDADAMAELDLVIDNREGMLRPAQREQAAAYVAHTAPVVALDGSPARSADYSVCGAYREALEWPVSRLLDQVMMLRHMTGQRPLPGGLPAQNTGQPTDVWVLTANTGGPRPGQELGRVRASTQNAAALRGNSLLNTRGGYQMRRLDTHELGGWVEDFRAHGMVLRLEAAGDDYRVVQVADGRALIYRRTPEEAKRDALGDLTALFALGVPSDPEPIHAD
jgi:hypothetical protein